MMSGYGVPSNSEIASQPPDFCVSFRLTFYRSTAPVNTLRRARFGDDDFSQQWQLILQLFPNPNRDVFARGIFESGNLVQVKMVQFLPNRFERFRDVGIIHDPSQLLITFPDDGDLDFETVPMQSPAFMRLGQMRQEMRGFKLKGFAKFH